MKLTLYNILYILLLLTILFLGLLYPTEYYSNSIVSCYSSFLQYILHSKESNPFYCRGRRWKYKSYPKNI